MDGCSRVAAGPFLASNSINECCQGLIAPVYTALATLVADDCSRAVRAMESTERACYNNRDCLFVGLFVGLFVCWFGCLFVCLLVRLFVCSFVRLPFHLPLKSSVGYLTATCRLGLALAFAIRPLACRRRRIRQTCARIQKAQAAASVSSLFRMERTVLSQAPSVRPDGPIHRHARRQSAHLYVFRRTELVPPACSSRCASARRVGSARAAPSPCVRRMTAVRSAAEHKVSTAVRS